MNTNFVRKCAICGKDFVATSRNIVRCPVCRKLPYYINKTVMHYVKCARCGKMFQTSLYNKRFCSNDCRSSFHYNLDDHTTKICPYCGRPFITRKRNKIYCSTDCREKYNFLKRDKVDHPEVIKKDQSISYGGWLCRNTW